MTVAPLKYVVVLAMVLGAAAGLNMGVLGLGSTDPSVEVAAAESASGASIAEQAAEPALPETVQLTVDVPVVVDLPATTTAPARAPAASTAQTVASATQSAQSGETETQPTPPTVGAPVTTTLPTTRAPATTQTAPATTSAPLIEYLYYDFPGVASQIVIADHGGSRLEFWSVTVVDGWSYRVEADSRDHVEIEFRRGGGDEEDEDEAKFEITRESGELKIKREHDD
ncbi:MAG: hypothetical protein ACR2O6_14370 [Ilumatobacteraceae bacterium]